MKNQAKDKKLALKLGIQTYQILTNVDEVCIPSLSSILLAVKCIWQENGRKETMLPTQFKTKKLYSKL